nr:integrase, catalytic region, zinc finger, CCHC-type, peptidase aspartic, catalytic [Tanacetum cinerariifolium]
MANMSEDIQCAGSDTRPPMLDRTDFASWQQRIRLYCRGKDNGMNILKSIDEGMYQMGTVRETLEKDRYNADIRATNILLQGLPKDIYTLINHYTDAKDIWDNHKGDSIHDYYVRFAKLINDMRNIKMTMSRMQLNSKFVNNMLPEWGRFVTAVKLNRGLRDSNYDQVGHGMNPQGGGPAGYGGAQNRDDDCDAFDFEVDEAPTAQTMFMANPSSADLVTDEAGPSYDSDVLSEVQDHDHYQDAVCVHHEEHAMHESVQLNHVVDSHADYTSDSNMIPYDRPKPYYNELNKVAIGYKNPLCLTRAKQVQPTLYNGHEIIKDNHAPAIVHNTEDTLEIAEITRKKMNDKMKDPEFFVIGKMQASLQGKDNVIRQLKKQISQLQVTRSDTDRTLKVRTAYSQITKLTEQVTNLQAQNNLFRAENDKIKQHYKELNNRDAHLNYLRHLKESVETIRDIELLEYAIGICPQGSQKRDKQLANIPLIRKKQVTFAKQSDKSDSNIHKHVVKVTTQKTNVSEPPSTGVNSFPNASGSQPKSNTKTNRILPAKGVNKLPVEDQPRTNESHLRTSNRVDSSVRLKRTIINSNSDSVCQTCNKCLTSSNHDLCVATYLQSVVETPSIHHNCNVGRKVVQIILWYLNSSYSKHMTRDHSRFINFVKKFTGTVRFENDHFGAIMGYGDYVIGDSVISRVYYMEGMGHNLFFVGQSCDSNLEVAFRKHSCYVRDTDGVELIKGSRGSNLYTISVEDMMKSSPICLLSKASKNKSWLWHRRLNHLNFGTINDLVRKDLVRGLPRLKFEKDHLCSACQLGKSKKHTHKPKTENINLEVLHTLHMDLCGLIIFHQKTVPRTPQQNGVVKRRNRTLVEAARTILIFSKALMFLWAEAVATKCYTQNRSLIHTRHHKTPYELVHNKKPDLTFFRVFGALCYTTNDSKDLGKLQPTADIGIFVGYAPSRKGPAPNFLTSGQISSGLVPNPVPATPYAPPTNKELDILFQPMFDEYLEHPRVERPVHPAQAVQAPVNSAGTPSSTTIDQDAPSPSISPSTSALQSYSLHQGIAAEPHYMEDHPIAPVDNNPFVNVFALEPHSKASSSGDISSTEST